LAPEYRITATSAAVVAFAAAVHFQAMNFSNGTEQSIDSIANSPTEIRYIDWIITTSLLLVNISTLLRLGNTGK
jgi:hypothetical protein